MNDDNNRPLYLLRDDQRDSAWYFGVVMVLVGILLGACLGCADDGVAVERTTNQNVPVTLLLEHDGYRVFRFYDAGKYHYFVVPEGVVDYGWSESRGKSSVEERGEIQTERGGR